MRLSEAFDQYEIHVIRRKGLSIKTSNNYRCTRNSFIKSITDLPVKLLTPEHIVKWQIDQESIGNAVSTINHDLCRLKQVLKFLRKTGHNVLDEEHIELPKIPQRKYTWLEYKEVQALIDVIDRPRDKAIVACLFATGCRISELLALNREDISGNKAQIIGKGDRTGVVRFDEKALEYLNDYLITRKDSLHPLFISGQRRRIKASTVGKLLHEYADLAGIEKNVTPHVFRHSFATDLKLNGADIYEIKEQLRHKRVSSTEIYTHIGDNINDSVYNKYHSH